MTRFYKLLSKTTGNVTLTFSPSTVDLSSTWAPVCSGFSIRFPNA